MSKLDCALDLARKGFRVFPLPADNKAIPPKELKIPHLKNWPALATTDEKKIRKLWSDPEFNIGIATGDGLVALDYDMKEGQRGAAALKAHDMLGLDLTGMNTLTATGGKHYLFKTNQAIPNSAGKIYQNVDVRGDRGYILGPGSTIHGRPYVAENITAIDSLPELPEWIAELATAKRSQSSVPAKHSLVKPDQPNQIQAATNWLQNDAPEAIEGHAGDETTYKTACRVRDFGISRQTCLELMLDWNEHKASPPWSLEDLEQKVANAYHYATLPAGIADAATELKLPQDVLDEVMAEVSRSETKETTKPPKFFFVSALEAAGLSLEASGDPLIKGILDRGNLSVLYGDSNQGKTFVELDLAFHIATGRPWNGRKVKQGLVVYVCAEGGRSIYKRFGALKKHYGWDGDIPFVVVPCPIDLLDKTAEGDTVQLIRLIKEIEKRYGQSAEFIVIDTLSRALAGGEENSSVDMGLLVRHLDKIRERTKAAVSVVHHTGKDQAKGARGHSLLRAATDTEIEVNDNKISTRKQRDMDRADPIHFRLKTIELGANKDGDQVTSNVIEIVAAPEMQPDETLTKVPRALLKHLRGMANKRRQNVTEGDSPKLIVGSREVLDYLNSLGELEFKSLHRWDEISKALGVIGELFPQLKREDNQYDIGVIG